MDFARVRETVGKVWGQTTTLALAVGGAALPVLQSADPSFVQDHPVVKTTVVVVGVGVAVLRVVAPPPPSVPIHIDDAVTVDHDAGTVTVTKPAAIPAGIVTKAAGEQS
jgi:hypothetical protein